MPDRVISHTLKTLAAVAGTGNEVTGTIVDVQDCHEGRLYLNCTAIDGATTLAMTVDYLDATETVAVDSGVSITNITATGQAQYAFTNIGGKLRFNYTLTNAKNATFSAQFEGRARL